MAVTQTDPFNTLAQALQEPDLGIYCPGGECSIVDEQAVVDFGDEVIGILSGPTYELGTLLPKAPVPEIDVGQLVDSGLYRLPYPSCAVHFECPYGDDVLDEIMVLQQLDDKIGVTVFTHMDNDWHLIPLTLLVDPEDLPYDGSDGNADCVEVDGIGVAVTDPEDLDEAMSMQTEFLHRVVEAIAPGKRRLH
jgi:hypothetical protein